MRIVALLAAFVALAACETNYKTRVAALDRTDGTATIVLMPVDVELSEVTAFAGSVPKAEWTDTARRHLADALKVENAARGLALREFEMDRVAAPDADKIDQLSKLHGAVGTTILLQESGELQLPARQDRFDWTLGPEARTLKAATGADYALFIFLRDSYASAGRIALQVMSALAGVGLEGGRQVGFASLVDLDDGNIVWFNRVLRGTGDLRNAEAARETARTLLAGLPR